MNDRRQILTRRSFKGESPQNATHSPDCKVQLQEHPLRRKGIYMDMAYAELNGIGCWTLNSESGFLASVEPLSDYVLLHWVRSGHIVFHERRRQSGFSTGSVFLWHSEALHRVEHMPELDFHVATIRRNDIDHFARSLTGNELTKPIEFLPIPNGTSNERGLRFVLATLANAVLNDSGLGGSPLAAASLKDMVLGALLELCPNTITKLTQAGSSEPRAVALAQAYMRAHMSEPIRVSEIAEASGVSLRVLQTAFRRSTGKGLVEYLRSVRLERTRLDLMDPLCSPLVSQIAYRWGFHHLSDFSRRYTEAYGEHPRTTLRRSRRT